MPSTSTYRRNHYSKNPAKQIQRWWSSKPCKLVLATPQAAIAYVLIMCVFSFQYSILLTTGSSIDGWLVWWLILDSWNWSSPSFFATRNLASCFDKKDDPKELLFLPRKFRSDSEAQDQRGVSDPTSSAVYWFQRGQIRHERNIN